MNNEELYNLMSEVEQEYIIAAYDNSIEAVIVWGGK